MDFEEPNPGTGHIIPKCPRTFGSLTKPALGGRNDFRYEVIAMFNVGGTQRDSYARNHSPHGAAETRQCSQLLRPKLDWQVLPTMMLDEDSCEKWVSNKEYLQKL